MKLDDIGIHHHMEQLSPAVIEAQRMAEMNNLSTYRAKRIREYMNWSDPVKRAEIQSKYKIDEALGRDKLKDIPAAQVAVRTSENWDIRLNITDPYKKPAPKLTWFQRLVRPFTIWNLHRKLRKLRDEARTS